MSNRGNYICLFSGGIFYPLDPRPEEVHIEDIAHSLALQCRYTGHTREPYSVGEHSVRASYLVSPKNCMWTLLHDATEAYLTDMSRPVKVGTVLGEEYRKVEHNLMRVICAKFHLAPEEPAEVKLADNIMLMTEKRDLLNCPPGQPKWQENSEPLAETIKPWSWKKAERLFLARYRELEKYERRKNN